MMESEGRLHFFVYIVHSILTKTTAELILALAARISFPRKGVQKGDVLKPLNGAGLLLVYDAVAGNLPTCGYARLQPPPDHLAEFFYKTPYKINGRNLWVDLTCGLFPLHGESYVQLGRLPLRYLDLSKIKRRLVQARKNGAAFTLA